MPHKRLRELETASGGGSHRSSSGSSSSSSSSSSGGSSSSKNDGNNLDSRKKPAKGASFPTSGSKSSSSSPISSGLFSRQGELTKQHASSSPYTHVVIDGLCEDSRMRSIYQEATSEMVANYKETDLFKVYQTGDLACIDDKNPDIAAKIPHLIALRDSLYSPEFREFISKVTDCGELTDRVDCSANAYPQSGHLLCHDDVIGTRKLSYIIYLTDPNELWEDKDGGALELYPLEPSCVIRRGKDKGGDQGIPTASPTKNLLPVFNRMVVFVVQPGRSYHSVQEVFNEESPRLSISGWYHGKEPPVGSDLASLQQVMGKSSDPEKPFKSMNPSLKEASDVSSYQGSLTKDDITFLSKYINKDFLKKEVISMINKRFCEDSSVQLSQFLKPVEAAIIQGAVASCDEEDHLGNGQPSLNYSAGVTKNWKIVGPPHKQRYMRYEDNDGSKPTAASAAASGKSTNSNSPHNIVGQKLNSVLNELLHSPQFARFVHELTSIGVSKVRGEVRRFRAGLDYTVAHYGILTTIPRLDATLCFVDCEDEDKETLWEDGDVGGFECYIVAEDDANTAEAAEVYKISDNSSNSNTGKKGNGYKEEEESLLSVSAKSNVLNLVLRDEKVMKFVKYVSAFAPGSRFDVAAEYEIIP